jgi:hypothetical protein
LPANENICVLFLAGGKKSAGKRLFTWNALPSFAVAPWRLAGKGMANDKQRHALLVIGKHLKTELDRAPAEPKPDIERALRRLLERDVAERSRPHTRWSGKAK